MDENVIRALFMFGGFVIGTGLGSLYSTNRHVKRITDASEDTNRMVHDLHDRLDIQRLPQVGKPNFGWRPPSRDEKGAMSWTNIGVLICVVVVCMALFSTLSANRQLTAANERIAATQEAQARSQIISDRENACTTNVLFGIVDAINPRARVALNQASANVALQKAQLVLLKTPMGASPAQGLAALQTYVRALTTFIKTVGAVQRQAVLNPYPDRRGYSRCLRQARDKPVSDTTGGDL